MTFQAKRKMASPESYRRKGKQYSTWTDNQKPLIIDLFPSCSHQTTSVAGIGVYSVNKLVEIFISQLLLFKKGGCYGSCIKGGGSLARSFVYCTISDRNLSSC